MVSSTDFNVEEGGSKVRELNQVVEEFNNATITHLNYSTFLSKLLSRVQIIHSTIDNHNTQFAKLANQLTEQKEKIGESRLKQMRENNIIPLQIFTIVNDMSFHLREMLAWKIIESELMFPILNKFGNALGEVSAYEVESRVLDAMRESQNRMLTHAENMMTTKMAQQDQKIDFVVKQLHERTDLALEKQLLLLNEMLKKSQEAEHRKLELYFDFMNRHFGSNEAVMREMYDLRKKFDKQDSTTRDDFKAVQAIHQMPRAPVDMFQPEPKRVVENKEAPVVVDSRKFKCPHCSERFKDAIQLETHVEVEHSMEDPYGDEVR
jgi:hypothetical protein